MSNTLKHEYSCDPALDDVFGQYTADVKCDDFNARLSSEANPELKMHLIDVVKRSGMRR